MIPEWFEPKFPPRTTGLALLAVCAVIVLAGDVAADPKRPVSVAMLAEFCEHAAVSSIDPPELTAAQQADAEWCRAYIRGVHDASRLVETENADRDALVYCSDKDVNSIYFMVRIFKGWMKRKWDKTDLPAAEGVVRAMRWQFPC